MLVMIGYFSDMSKSIPNFVYFQIMKVVVHLNDLTNALCDTHRRRLQVEEARPFHNFGKSTTELDGHLANFLLLIDVFTRMESHPEAGKELFVALRRENRNGIGDKQIIEKFKLEYSFETAIR